MNCPSCGSTISPDAAFCTVCGAKAVSTSPNSAVITDDGIRRWVAELNLWSNATILITTFKVLALAGLFPALLMLVLGLAEGDGAGAVLVFFKVYGMVMAVLLVLLAFGYVLLALMYGGKYCVVFEMDDQEVRHTQLQKQVKRAQALGMLTMLAGAASGNPTAMGAGLLAASRQTAISRFKKIRSITVHQRRQVIYITTSDQIRNQIYPGQEDFQSIVDHIVNHAPKQATIRYK
jgi:hypothetical protein